MRLKHDAPRIEEGIVFECEVRVPGRDSVGHPVTKEMQTVSLLNARKDIAEKLLDFEWEEITDDE